DRCPVPAALSCFSTVLCCLLLPLALHRRRAAPLRRDHPAFFERLVDRVPPEHLLLALPHLPGDLPANLADALADPRRDLPDLLGRLPRAAHHDLPALANFLAQAMAAVRAKPRRYRSAQQQAEQ